MVSFTPAVGSGRDAVVAAVGRPSPTTDRTWYLAPDGRLDDDAPHEAGASTTFRYDPMDPTPSVGGRMLAKYPGITAVGGIAMAVAIAVGASAFEVISVLLRDDLPLLALAL